MLFAIWAILIPLGVLAISWECANRREARAARAGHGQGAKPRPGGVPRCARRSTTSPDDHPARLL